MLSASLVMRPARPLALALAAAPTPAAAACTSALGCSLNGECTAAGACRCDSGWHGAECELLSLGPAPPGGAYGYSPNISSWGAHVVRWPADGLYHMWVSELWGGCGINSWRQNSHVVHATSATALGPYQYRDTSLPPESTCNHVLVNGSEILLYHQFTSGGGGKQMNCSQGWEPPRPETWTPVKPHKVHSSTTGPGGPWLASGGQMPHFVSGINTLFRNLSACC
eukprot:SAG22_NODE_62_length_23371_cov_84.500602_22_plen_225_part_00